MSKKILIILIVVGAVFFGVLGYFLFVGDDDIHKIKADLEFWGVFDNSDTFNDLIKKFRQEYPSVKISYKKKEYVDYERDLVNDLAAGRGPDIFMIHNTWLPKHGDKIYPMEPGISEWQMSGQEFKNTFVDVAASDFLVKVSDPSGGVSQERIYAVPLFVDTLALYWNKEVFNTAGITKPPQTWEEFEKDVQQLTQKDESGNILFAGAALGTSQNVNRANDILAMLMLQTGVNMVSNDHKKATFNTPVKMGTTTYNGGLESLNFYARFADPNNKSYTWNNQQHYSFDAFSEGKAAMMISYSFHMQTIKNKQPHLKFGVSAVPQPAGAKVKVTYPNYWGLTASLASSENANDVKAAWIFIKWLTQKDRSKEYLSLAQRPAARRDLIEAQKTETPDLGVFAQQSLSAISWYQADNNSIDKIFNDMIDAVNSGRLLSSQAISQAVNDVTVIMQKAKK